MIESQGHATISTEALPEEMQQNCATSYPLGLCPTQVQKAFTLRTIVPQFNRTLTFSSHPGRARTFSNRSACLQTVMLPCSTDVRAMLQVEGSQLNLLCERRLLLSASDHLDTCKFLHALCSSGNEGGGPSPPSFPSTGNNVWFEVGLPHLPLFPFSVWNGLSAPSSERVRAGCSGLRVR